MGGLGSSRWRRHRRKQTAESCFQLRVGKLKLSQGQGSVIVKGQAIALTWTPCHFGGQRPWLVCPKCGKRVGVIYLSEGHLACRHCHRLTHVMSQLGKFDRLNLQNRRLRQRLGVAQGHMISRVVSVPSRPEGMSRRSYVRVVRRIERNELQFAVQMTRQTVSFFERLTGKPGVKDATVNGRSLGELKRTQEQLQAELRRR